ncbi:hypothetical protein YQE_04988, partial [Dendroctonus ponderosae]
MYKLAILGRPDPDPSTLLRDKSGLVVIAKSAGGSFGNLFPKTTELSHNLQQLSERAKSTTEFIQRLKGMSDKVNISHQHSAQEYQFEA